MSILLINCGRKDEQSIDHAAEAGDQIIAYEEGDSLLLEPFPSVLSSWLKHYQTVDTGFVLARFKASGVNLHIGELPPAISKGNESGFTPYFFYSPDKSRYLDLVSYNHFLDEGKMLTGEVDQQVVLGDAGRKNRSQLMYYGPSQLAEAAAWINNKSFVLATSSRTDDGKGLKAEILLFNLGDSLYTNFQLDHIVPLDSAVVGLPGFLEKYFGNKQ